MRLVHVEDENPLKCLASLSVGVFVSGVDIGECKMESRAGNFRMMHLSRL